MKKDDAFTKSNKRTLVFALGFDTTHVIARLSEVNLSKEERIVFFLPSENSPRVESAITAIENYISILNSRGMRLTVEFQRLNEHDFMNSLKSAYELLEDSEMLQIELSGGLRILNLLLLYIACLFSKKVIAIYTRLETDSSLVKIPMLPIVRLRPQEIKILQLIKDAPLTLRELAHLTGYSMANLSRIFNSLTNFGFVEILNTYPRRYKLSLLGYIIQKANKTIYEDKFVTKRYEFGG